MRTIIEVAWNTKWSWRNTFLSRTIIEISYCAIWCAWNTYLTSSVTEISIYTTATFGWISIVQSDTEFNYCSTTFLISGEHVSCTARAADCWIIVIQRLAISNVWTANFLVHCLHKSVSTCLALRDVGIIEEVTICDWSST